MSDEDSRLAQIAILEDARDADRESADFLRLVRMLGFREGDRVAVWVALQVGHWRRAKQPFKSVRRWVCARALDREQIRKPRSKDIWARRTQDAGVDPDSLEPGCIDDEPSIVERMSPRFRSINPRTRELSVRWDLVQVELKLSRVERKALELQLQGVELNDALARERRASSKQSLAKAWAEVTFRRGEFRAVLFGAEKSVPN